MTKSKDRTKGIPVPLHNKKKKHQSQAARHQLNSGTGPQKPKKPGNPISIQRAQEPTNDSDAEQDTEERLGSKRKAPSNDDSRQDQPKRVKVQSADGSTTTQTLQLPPKATPLPEDALVRKRPLFHPPIPSPYSGPNKPKPVYISASSSFMGTVKRVQKLLLLAEKRFNTRVDASKGKEKEKSKRGGARTKESDEIEEVVLKGTGRAIERVVSIAVFLQAKEELVVRLKVGSVSVVDDIELRGNSSGVGKSKEEGKVAQNPGESGQNDNGVASAESGNAVNGHRAGDGSDGESAFEASADAPTERPAAKPTESEKVPETRVRHVNMLEVGVTLRSILRYEQSLGKNIDGGYPMIN